MSEIRFIYTIQTNGEETPTPVTVQANRILKIDDVGASIMLGDTVHIVRGRDLYIPPADVAHGLMFGTDRKKLCKAWDTAVKKAAMSILNRYARYFTAHEDGGMRSDRLSTPAPAKPVSTPPKPPEKPKAATPAPTSAAPPAPAPRATVEGKGSAEQGPGPVPVYPHACMVSWNSIEAFIPKLVSKWFPSKESRITARTIFGSYAESNEGWAFVLEDVSDGDREALTALLAEHDVLHEVSIETEWPEGEPPSSVTFPLTTAISNHILATEFLPSLTPPFTYGVSLAIPNAEGLVLVSDAPVH